MTRKKWPNIIIQVYGLNKLHRVEEPEGGADETMGIESLLMFKFTNRPAPRGLAHGGKHAGVLKDMPHHGVRMLFTTDLEGHLAENVQLLPPPIAH